MSSATDKTHAGIVEHAADKINTKTAETKATNKRLILDLTEEST
jgi:hypothetical protein